MKGMRTLLFNFAIVLLGTTLTFVGQVDWAQYVEAKYLPWVLTLVGLANMGLRMLTTGPAGVAKE